MASDTFELQTKYRKSENIVFRKIGDECILVPIRHDVADIESVYSLNEVSARIWELIDGERTVAGVISELLAEYEVEEDKLRGDVERTIGELVDIGGLEQVE